MTRRDYIAAAAILNDGFHTQRTQFGNGVKFQTQEATRQDIGLAFADLFEKDNPNFDRDRFLIAAGIPRPTPAGVR